MNKSEKEVALILKNAKNIEEACYKIANLEKEDLLKAIDCLLNPLTIDDLLYQLSES